MYKVHCYSDRLINEEIYDLYIALNKILNKHSYTDYDSIKIIIYILERISFIEDYYRKLGSDEFPHYMKNGNNIERISKSELIKTYKNEIVTYKKFMKDLNKCSVADVEEIIKAMHKALNLNIPQNLYKGLIISESENIYYWEADRQYSTKNCIRYLVNTIKHCYGYDIIVKPNGNATAYVKLSFINIAKDCVKCIEKYYDVK